MTVRPHSSLHFRGFSTVLESEAVGPQDFFEEGMRFKNEDQMNDAAASFKEAAELGHAGALVQLGHLHMTGQGGVAMDASQAHYSFKLAAEKKHPEGLRQLANCHIRGIGVDCNVYKSVPYLEEAAELGEGAAQALLGIFYYSGVAGERDLYKASDWLVKGLYNDTIDEAAKDDASKSLFVIINQFVEGGDLARKDPIKSFELLNQLRPHADKSFEQHVVYLLAQAHGTGAGTEEDMEQAMTLLEEAAELGSEEAKDMIEKFAAESDSDSDSN